MAAEIDLLARDELNYGQCNNEVSRLQAVERTVIFTKVVVLFIMGSALGVGSSVRPTDVPLVQVSRSVGLDIN